MYDLTLKIGEVYNIRINYSDRPDTGSRKIQSCRSAESSGSDYENFCVKEFLLAFDTDFFKNDMPAVTLKLFICKSHYLPPPMKYRNSTSSPSFNT